MGNGTTNSSVLVDVNLAAAVATPVVILVVILLLLLACWAYRRRRQHIHEQFLQKINDGPYIISLDQEGVTDATFTAWTPPVRTIPANPAQTNPVEVPAVLYSQDRPPGKFEPKTPVPPVKARISTGSATSETRDAAQYSLDRSTGAFEYGAAPPPPPEPVKARVSTGSASSETKDAAQYSLDRSTGAFEYDTELPPPTKARGSTGSSERQNSTNSVFGKNVAYVPKKDLFGVSVDRSTGAFTVENDEYHGKEETTELQPTLVRTDRSTQLFAFMNSGAEGVDHVKPAE